MFHNYLQSLPKPVSNETARVKTTLGGKSSKEPRFGSVMYFTLTAISSIAKHNNPLPGKRSVSRKEYLLAQTPQQHVWLGALCWFPAPPGSSQPPGLQQLLWLHMQVMLGLTLSHNQLTPLKLNRCQVVKLITAGETGQGGFAVSSVTALAAVFRLGCVRPICRAQTNLQPAVTRQGSGITCPTLKWKLFKKSDLRKQLSSTLILSSISVLGSL